MPSAIVEALEVTRRHARAPCSTASPARRPVKPRRLIGPNGRQVHPAARAGGPRAALRGHVRRHGTIGYMPQLADADVELLVRDVVLRADRRGGGRSHARRLARALQAAT